MVEYNSSGKRAETAFNIGLFQAYYVSEVYKSAFNNWFRGDLVQWFYYLKGLRKIIRPDLADPEFKDFQIREKKIIEKQHNFKMARTKKEYMQGKNDYEQMVEDYEEQVLLCMKVAGYLPTKRDRAKLGF